MIVSLEFEKARQLAIAYIGIDHSKSSGRVRQNLLKKGVDPKLADEVVDYFIVRDYIDDRRAAKRVAARYKGRRTRSKRAMVQVFIQNGVDIAVAKKIAEDLPDDRETALLLCRAHIPNPTKDDDMTLLKLLARRGYAIGLSRDIIAALHS